MNKVKVVTKNICGLKIPLQKVKYRVPIETAVCKSFLSVSLKQFSGEKVVPLVRKGEKVKRGQKIAESSSPQTVPVFSPVAGRVAGLISGDGTAGSSVTIDPYSGEGEIEERKTYADYFRYTPSELIEIIRQSGIVGLGGTGYPCHLKLKRSKEKDVRTLIINGTECDPFLSADDTLMQAYVRDIVLGIRMIMYILDLHSAQFAIGEDKKRALELFGKEAYNEPNLFLVPVPVCYPNGEERQLIYTLSGIPLPNNDLPSEAGAIVFNVATVYAISRAIKNGEPYSQRIITVNGDGIKTPMNVWAPNGVQVKDIIDFAGGTVGDDVNIIAGGVMNGVYLNSQDLPLDPTLRGIIVLQKKSCPEYVNYPCIRCGKCSRVCPVNLQPDRISVLIEDNKTKEAIKYFPGHCISCGLCSFVCPSHRDLTKHILSARENKGNVQP